MRGSTVATNTIVSAPRLLFRRQRDSTRRGGTADPTIGHRPQARNSVRANKRSRRTRSTYVLIGVSSGATS